MEDFLEDTYLILDQIEFEEFMVDGAEINSIMNGVVSKLYTEDYRQVWEQIKGTPLQYDLFNFIDEYDFLVYCSNRYDVDWETKTLYYCKKEKKDLNE